MIECALESKILDFSCCGAQAFKTDLDQLLSGGSNG